MRIGGDGVSGIGGVGGDELGEWVGMNTVIAITMLCTIFITITAPCVPEVLGAYLRYAPNYCSNKLKPLTAAI